MNILQLIGRSRELFADDMAAHEDELLKIVGESSFLIIGGAGSIGQAVTREIFSRSPRKMHVVDISENNLVELMRDIRSTYGYIAGDFRVLALDVGSIEYEAFMEADGEYDYVLNLSALKHVRSEKDPYTLMRMIGVNILNTVGSIQQSVQNDVKKYFCVSTDKAANPVNMMGASKRIMEMFLMRHSRDISISTARFANVAFSDGSLLHGFNQRMQKRQPIVAPTDVMRYFITPAESGQLCLMSCIYGDNRDVFFPKLQQDVHLTSFAEIAVRYLDQLGYEPYFCETEEEARQLSQTMPQKKKWPCYFTITDTTGEKDVEEFYTDTETLDLSSFAGIGVIKNELLYDEVPLDFFINTINQYKRQKRWSKEQLLELFTYMVPEFAHKDTGKYLDAKM
jgi:FlaA1/EpsC-like NDP-sugar epimerase